MRTIAYGTRAHARWKALAAALGDAADATWCARSRRSCAPCAREGDAALVRLTARLDGVRLTPARLRVRPEEIRRLAARADADVVAALRRMAERIEAFHRGQLAPGFRCETADGSVLEEVVSPLVFGRPLRPRRRRCLPVVRPHERDPGARRRRRPDRRRHAAAHARGEPLRGGGDRRGRRRGARLPRRRGAGHRRARVRDEDDPGRRHDRRAPATRTWPRPSASCAAGSRSTARPGRARSRSSPTTPPTPASWPPTCWRRPSTAAATRRSCS